MTNNFVCHKCLNPLQSNDIFQKSDFEYFHRACIKNNELIDVTDKMQNWDDVDIYENIVLKTEVNKFGGKFIDLSSKEKIMEIYKNEKFKETIKKELKELEQVELNKLDDFSSDDFINEFNKNIGLLESKNFKNTQFVN